MFINDKPLILIIVSRGEKEAIYIKNYLDHVTQPFL